MLNIVLLCKFFLKLLLLWGLSFRLNPRSQQDYSPQLSYLDFQVTVEEEMGVEMALKGINLKQTIFIFSVFSKSNIVYLIFSQN